jgi:branched-chain amino acid transport system substrate-binding protein
MRLTSRKTQLACAAVVVAVAVSACSSSGSSSPAAGGSTTGASAGGTGSASTGKPIKIGIINDSTGVASSGFKKTEVGVKAYINALNAAGGVNGHQIQYVIADSTSSPTGAQTAAQKLVQQDKVFAIISVTSYFFGAEQYLLKAGVPVLGTGFDGPEWIDPKNTNLVNVIGAYNPASAYASSGQAVKKLGGTACGSIGYIESPSASGSAKAFGLSCAAAGLKNAYNQNIHFGDTNVGPTALQMKAKGVDSFYTAVQPATSFALAAALKQYNVTPKVAILPIGYGSDLLADKAATQAANGFYFVLQSAPVELNNAATQTLKARMAAAGETQSPGSNEMVPYLSLAALAAGLKNAGSDPTQQSLLTALRGIKDFDGEGLLAPEKVDFSSYAPTQQCSWYVKLDGSTFVPQTDLSPVCGPLLSTS